MNLEIPDDYGPLIVAVAADVAEPGRETEKRRPQAMSDYRAMYSAMSNDRLLNLAQDADTLNPKALDALATELVNRELDESDIAAYAAGRRSTEYITPQTKPVARSFNGIGTTLYGKRCFEADGSFITTKWITICWIPLIPLTSLRVKYVGPGESTILPGWSRKYLILSELQINARQVVNVYSFLVAFVLGGKFFDWLKADDWLFGVLFVVWACTPLALRTWERMRIENSQER